MTDRGILGNRAAFAGAHVVEAREALARCPGGPKYAADRARLVEVLRRAEDEKADADAALKAYSDPLCGAETPVQFAERLTAILERWNPETLWPLTITTGCDGFNFVAFPLELDEVPRELCEQADASRWLRDNHTAPFGSGITLEVALNDLLDRAAAIREAEKGTR